MVCIMQSWVDEGRDMTPAGTYCGHVMLSRMSQPSPVSIVAHHRVCCDSLIF